MKFMPDPRTKSKLNIVVDQRFRRTPDGRVWTHTPPSYEFFQSALEVFDELRIVARTFAVNQVPENARPVNGPRVQVIPIPSFVGPIQYLRRRRDITDVLRNVSQIDGAFLLRIPSHTAFVLAEMLEKSGRPYAVELLTDPFNFFAPGVAPHGLASLFRPYFCSRSKDLCARAIAANFITGSRTQKENPATNAAWSGSVSDVELSDNAFSLRAQPASSSPLEIVTVGFFDLLYKGQDILLRALAACRKQGLEFRLTIVGDGQSKATLLNLARLHKIEPLVHITGAVGGAGQVREYLQRAHLFTLPSRAEGIPRALLEAMAIGLPALCSNVGAMPDLLDKRWIVEPGSVEQLTKKIMEFARIPEQWNQIGLGNREVARRFAYEALAPRRKAFYETIRRHGFAQAPMSSLPEVIHAA